MGERVVPYTNSLVKYNVPHIVSLINEKEDRGRTKKVICTQLIYKMNR